MYPIVLTNLAQQRCVVVGGGAVAERKVAGLITGGANPIVISPQLTPQLQHWQASNQIQHLAREYQFGDCEAAFWLLPQPINAWSISKLPTNATTAQSSSISPMLLKREFHHNRQPSSRLVVI